MNDQAQDSYPPTSLRRRFGAMFYDSLLVIAISMIYGFICLGITAAVTGVGFSDTSADTQAQGLLFQLGWLAVVSCFYCYFWTRLGQTLGMQVWRIKVINTDGSPITLKQALIRCIVAPISIAVIGAGFWLSLFDQEKRTWHDRLSNSKIIHLPKS